MNTLYVFRIRWQIARWAPLAPESIFKIPLSLDFLAPLCWFVECMGKLTEDSNVTESCNVWIFNFGLVCQELCFHAWIHEIIEERRIYGMNELIKERKTEWRNMMAMSRRRHKKQCINENIYIYIRETSKVNIDAGNFSID